MSKFAFLILLIPALAYAGDREYIVYRGSFTDDEVKQFHNGEMPKQGIKKAMFWKDNKVEKAEVEEVGNPKFRRLKIRPSNKDEEECLTDLEKRGKIILIKNDDSYFDSRIGGHVTVKFKRRFRELEPPPQPSYFVEKSTP